MLRLTILAAALSALNARAIDDTDPEPDKPGPVRVRLVAKKSTYKLDLGGKTKDEYAKLAKEGAAPPVAVDLELVLRNNTKSDIRVRTVGTTTRLTLKLEGGGAVEAPPVNLPIRPKTAYVTVPPGKTVTIPITTLASYASRAKAKAKLGDKVHYWTEPGEYKLSAAYYTLFNLDYGQGKKSAATYLTLQSKPVTLTVEK